MLTSFFKMKDVRNFTNDFLLSALGGMMISIGGIVYLSVESKILGSILFSIGLFYVLNSGFYLFTGKVGYWPQNDFSYWKYLAVVWLGNFFGTFLTAFLFSITRNSNVFEKAEALSMVKLNDGILSIFILSVFCGILMFLAVDGFKTIDNYLGKCLATFLSVSVFILSGFEHCVANMFFFSAAKVWSLNTLYYLIIMSFGNLVGGCLIPIASKILKRNSEIEI